MSVLFPKILIGRNAGICELVTLMAASFLLATQFAMADGLIVSRTVTVESGYDSDETKTWYIDTLLGLSTGYWIYLAAQKDDVESEDDFDLDSRSYFAGFGSDPGSEWSYDLTYENWGNPGDIDTDALRATITWTRGDWAFSIMPQYREITLANVDNGDSFSFNEQGVGASVKYSGTDWELNLERNEYHFSKDPDSLEDTGVTDNLPFPATSLASGVYDHGTVMGIGRRLDPVNILLQYTREKSAIDNTLVETIETHVDYYISDDVIPYLRIGRASFPGFSPLWFGNLGLQVSW